MLSLLDRRGLLGQGTVGAENHLHEYLIATVKTNFKLRDSVLENGWSTQYFPTFESVHVVHMCFISVPSVQTECNDAAVTNTH